VSKGKAASSDRILLAHRTPLAAPRGNVRRQKRLAPTFRKFLSLSLLRRATVCSRWVPRLKLSSTTVGLVSLGTIVAVMGTGDAGRQEWRRLIRCFVLIAD
jgi:hypothetical protein